MLGWLFMWSLFWSVHWRFIEYEAAGESLFECSPRCDTMVICDIHISNWTKLYVAKNLTLSNNYTLKMKVKRQHTHTHTYIYIYIYIWIKCPYQRITPEYSQTSKTQLKYNIRTQWLYPTSANVTKGYIVMLEFEMKIKIRLSPVWV